MRLIGLLAVLLVIGFLVYRQIGPDSTPRQDPSSAGVDGDTPRVPTTANDLQRFDDEMNRFIRDAAADRERKSRDLEGK